MSFRNPQESGASLTVKDEGVVIATGVKSIDFAGAGVTGSAAGSDVTENIPGGAGAVWITEDVTGAIDGNNKAFTLSHTPVAGSLSLRLGRQPQEATTDYTLSGSNITYVNAPDSSLAAEPHKATYQY
jgi:hypothetical protein